MARRVAPLVLAALCALAVAAPAPAQEMSSNVERVATIPALKTAIAINFIDDTMFVSTAHGVYSYDVSDPADPTPLGALPMYIWENEDVDVDAARKRLFISRDPRGFTTPATPGALFPYGAVHIIDVSDPGAMRQLNVFTVPAGHTTSCVNQCDFVWTAGPYANEQTQPDWVGRPVFATDVRDPAKPKPCPEPIDTGRNDGVTDYAHDVQVDSRGIAWVSGAGGVRGYWTEGRHVNPLSGHEETATACDPIPYAGSGTPDTATPSRFMHNSFRDPGADPPKPAASTRAVASASRKHRKRARHRRARARHRKAGRPRCQKAKGRARACNPDAKPPAKGHDKPKPKPKPPKPKPPAPPAGPSMRDRTLYGTEENVVSDCATAGRFVTYDLAGTFDGEGWRDTARTHHRMKALDTWTPEGQDGSSGCASAHYFSLRSDHVSANSFYEQGVRFLDVSDPRNIRQVGWYRPDDANVWAPYWHKGYVFVADFTRGVDVLHFAGSRRSRTVTAPAVARTASLRFDRAQFAGLCPLKAPPGGP
jgi:hypothetical protein